MSPRARTSPACIAGCWPKLRLKRTALIARVARVESLDRRPGAVARAVVDDDDLERARIALEDLDCLRHDLL